MWVLVSIGVGLVALAVVGVAVLTIRRKSPDRPLGSELTADQWTALGVVFTGAGVALMLSQGPGMVGLLAVGFIYLAMGIRVKRNSPER